jgi:hypothetical protein
MYCCPGNVVAVWVGIAVAVGAVVGVDVDTLDVLPEVLVVGELSEPPGNPVAEKYTKIKIKLPARINKPAIINPNFVRLVTSAVGIWGGGT